MSLSTVTTIEALRDTLKPLRKAGYSVAFVPTMGNLHDGHLQLIKKAKECADKVVVSLFVNPTQFGAGEDFDHYPRTESEDAKKLDTIGIDLLFLPSVSEIYPENHRTSISVSGLSDLHCGKTRVGHFDGVATIVCKLFNIVQPDLAFFGEKDFQQLTIIRALVRDLNIPVEIRGIETVREADGLAMSSRNGYLSAEERLAAPVLYRSLCQARDRILAGEQNYPALEKRFMLSLREAGLQPEYFSVCRQSSLMPAGADDMELVILAAARLGKTRLIDNVYFSKTPL
jgi:pantoate--beta-alanine ligase